MKNFFSKLAQNEIAIALIIALFFGAFYAITWDHDLGYDEYRYLIVAKDIPQYLTPVYLGVNYFQHPPLAIYSITLFYFWTKDILLAGEISTLVFSMLAIFSFYFLARTALAKEYAMGTTAFFAVQPQIWGSANQVMLEIPLIFAIIAAMYFFLRANYSNKLKDFALTGLFAGIAILTRGQGLLLVPVIAIFFLASILSGQKKIQVASKQFAIIVVVALIILSPFLVHRILNNAPLYGDGSIGQILTGNLPWVEGGFKDLGAFYLFEHVFEIIHPFVFLLVLFGLFAVLTQKNNVWKDFAVLNFAIIAVSFFVMSIPAYKETRYVFHTMPSIVIIGGMGLQFLFQKITESSKLKMLTPVLFAIILLLFFVQVFTSGLPEKQIDYGNFAIWKDLEEIQPDRIVNSAMPYTVSYIYGNIDSAIDFNSQPKVLAILNNSEYIIYEGIKQTDSDGVFLKYYDDCNCSLYRLNKEFFNQFAKIYIVDSKGAPVRNPRIYFYEVKTGKKAFDIIGNAAGEVTLPFQGALYAMIETICYTPVGLFVNISDQDKVSICDAKECVITSKITIKETSCIINKINSTKY